MRPVSSSAAAIRLLPLGVAVAALVVYALTLQRTLPAGDSGELIAVAWGGGVAHPPGYPLYTMLAGALGRLFAFGEPALRLALFSATCQAAAAGVLAAALRRLGAAAPAAAGAALLWAFCAPAWKMALVAEVFALNSLLAAGLWLGLAVLLSAIDVRSHRRALAALLALTTLGLSHHQTLFILALPVDAVALVVWWRRGRPGGSRRFVAFLCGLAFLCALPLAWLMLPHQGAAPVWGDTATWSGLWRHLLRRDYGTFSLEPAGAGYVTEHSHAWLWLKETPRAFAWLGALLAAVGLAALGVRAVRGAASARSLLAAAAGALALQAVFFTRVGYPLEPTYLRGVVERFTILPAMTMALLAGLALQTVAGAHPWRRMVLGLTAAAAVAAPLCLHWRAVDQHDNTFHADFVHNLLASVPDGAVLFVRGDLEHNGLAYAQGVLGGRRELALADQELLTYDWYVRRLRARAPGLLPPLDRADRLRLADGRTLTGRLRAGPPDSLRLLTLGGWQVVAATDVVGVERDLPPTIFAAELAAENGGRFLAGGADRYSGLPGSQDVFWLDHLLPGRSVAVTETREASWSRWYTAVPHGLVQVMVPRGTEPPVAEQAREAARLLAVMRLDSWFRPQDPWSFESASRERLGDFILATMQLLARPEAAGVRRAESPGLAVLDRWLARYCNEAKLGDPRLDYACGFLHLLHPDFRDLAAAADDLARLRVRGATDPAAARAADLLASALDRAPELGGN